MVECSVLFPTCVEVYVYVKRGWIYFQVNIVSSFGLSLGAGAGLVLPLGGCWRLLIVGEAALLC